MKLIKRIIKFFDRHLIIPITRFFVSIGKKLKIINKPLEGILRTKRSIIILSLVFAIVIFFVVDRASTTLVETEAEVLYNQPVTANYNDEEYVVEGLPDKVDITMIGTKANLYLAKQLPSQNVTVDLSDLTPGVHEVKLNYKQAITAVEYKLDPSIVTVVVSTKQSATKDISYEVLNLTSLDSKMSIKDIELSTNSVIAKGTEDKLNKIATIKALINVNNLTDPAVGENTIKDNQVVAYDENGKILNVELVPNKVDAKVEIESPSKTVPLKVVPVGLDRIVFGKSVESITSSVSEVTIYGSEKALSKVSSIDVKVDVSDIKTNKKYTKTIKKPAGIREVSVKTVTIEISLGDESSTELSDVRLSYINLGENYAIENVDTTTISVILKGVSSVIDKISPSDINAYIDLNNLGPGEHDVNVIVEGNDEKVQYTPKTTKVKVQIADK
ncbi:MAG: hypothetical protein IKZ96_04175 [Bacilli bacterium]|nr:hypothetical protein [Bacilli bacterium]